MKTLTNSAALLKAIPESLLWLTDFSVRALAAFFSKPLCTVNRVSESHSVSLLAGFSKPDMTVNIRSSSSAFTKKGFHNNNRLTETW